MKNKVLEKENILLSIHTQEDKEIAFEQYKLLADSLDDMNQVRESSNTFWITVNTVMISGVSYLRGYESINRDQFAFLMWSSLTLGICFCISWLYSLISIKNSLSLRNRILIEIEKTLPAKIFTTSFGASQNKENKMTLTTKEMLVPGIFLVGYVFFIVLLIFIPRTVLGKG